MAANGLGARVRLVRRRQQMTQKQLAAAAGCSQQTIVDIETVGTRSRYLPAIARALGESVDWLETGAGVSPTTAELLPHYDLWALATAPEAPVDRLFADPWARSPEERGKVFTVSVDAAAASRSGGMLRELDALVCVAAKGSVRPGWWIAWAAGWGKAEIYRLVESEGVLYLSPPVSERVELSRPVRATLIREEAAEAAEGDIPTVWLCARVVGLVREF